LIVKIVLEKVWEFKFKISSQYLILQISLLGSTEWFKTLHLTLLNYHGEAQVSVKLPHSMQASVPITSHQAKELSLTLMDRSVT